MSFRDKAKRTPLPFGLDFADINESTSKENLKYPLPVCGAITELEEETSSQFLNFAELMRNSSFYTGTLESLTSENSRKTYLEGGVNDGLKRYSDRYRKKITVKRSIHDHPFTVDFFPEELQSVIAGKSNNKSRKKKSLALSNYSKGQDKDLSHVIKLSEGEKQKQMMERLNNINENDEDAAEVEEEEEEEDDEFEEEDDDDYNAEKYFDDGDDYGEEDEGDEEAAF